MMMSSKNYQFVVESDEDVRLDIFLVEKFPEISRSQIKRYIEAGNVSLDGVTVSKAGTKVKNQSSITMTIEEDVSDNLVPENMPLDILYEDEQVIVLNKPAGVIVHPGAGNSSGTLVNGLLAYYPKIRNVGEPTRPGVVHRLDKDTSGVIIFAKTGAAYRWLVKQFKSRDLDKAYIALVEGHPPTPTGRIEAPIERDLKIRTRMAVGLRGFGKPAISEYFERQRYFNYSLLEVHPITGRTHQIRVHLSYIGTPVVGDTVYGHHKPSIDLDRIFLHAKVLSIRLPGERVAKTYEAPLPQELDNILNNLEPAKG
jgi:23S rRNA pseudouridine1911/1915/1917 synthase